MFRLPQEGEYVNSWLTAAVRADPFDAWDRRYSFDWGHSSAKTSRLKSRHEDHKAVIEEGIMELQQYRFCYAGSGMNFAVFSDDPCRTRYVKSIPIPIGYTEVELYEIEPSARTRWIVVQEINGHKTTLKVFLRQGNKFLENSMVDLSRETKNQIMQRFPRLAAERNRPMAA
jgi:hypothetical protein